MLKAARKLRDLALRWRHSTGGNIAVISALTLPIVIGAFGVGAEATSWMTSYRGLQNAADAAAISAATDASANYSVEAQAVAAQYGLQNGVNGVTITSSNAATCPSGVTGPCYSVTISKPQPLMLAQVVGFKGDVTYAGGPAKLVRATAVAQQGTQPRSYCILALGTSGVDPALRSNGAPNANLSGCDVMSNTSAVCNGHNLGADIGDAHKTNNGCGVVQHSNIPTVADPYSGLATNIPADPCGGKYPQEPAKKSGTPLPSQNKPAGAMSWSGSVALCGDVQLSGNVTVGQDATIVIYNGMLDLNGFSLTGASGAGITVVFAGSNSYNHTVSGSGTLDFAAPTSGPWSGMALYQAPNMTSGVNMSYAGNNPTWNITGMGYFPHASMTFSGAVNKSSNGQSCFGMVVDNLLINGTANIIAHGQCAKAGLALPTAMLPGRGKLVL